MELVEEYRLDLRADGVQISCWVNPMRGFLLCTCGVGRSSWTRGRKTAVGDEALGERQWYDSLCISLLLGENVNAIHRSSTGNGMEVIRKKTETPTSVLCCAVADVLMRPWRRSRCLIIMDGPLPGIFRKALTSWGIGSSRRRSKLKMWVIYPSQAVPAMRIILVLVLYQSYCICI